MYLLAPAVLCIGLSFALYGTVDIWKMDIYKMQSKNIPPQVATDVSQLKEIVQSQQISGQAAEHAFQQKYGVPSSRVEDVMAIN